MTAALIQRTRTLQEENDELYDLLRVSETGKLKEEVHHLKRTISRLERALKGTIEPADAKCQSLFLKDALHVQILILQFHL